MFLKLSCTSMLLSVWVINVLSITREKFIEFRDEIEYEINCDKRFPGTMPLGAYCSGLRLGGPYEDVLVTRHDLADIGFRAFRPVLAGLIRLSFHDCMGINTTRVAEGKVSDWTNRNKNGESGGCNGCIGIPDNAANNYLYQAAIEPIEEICNKYINYGNNNNGGGSVNEDYFSRADCWALAGTIAVELAAKELTFSQGIGLEIYASINSSDIPYYYGRKDCINGYEGSDPSLPGYFSNPPGVTFEFPDESLAWDHIVDIMKEHFSWRGDPNYFTNRDIIALVSGAHSVGRAHEKISGYSGGWDFGPDTIDPEFISILHHQDWTFTEFHEFTQNLNQSIRNPISGNPNAKPQWSMDQGPVVQQLFPFIFAVTPPVTSFEMNFNSDVAMVYDLSYYIENDRKFDIDCQTNAYGLCPTGEIVLTANRGVNPALYNFGKTGEELDEQYVCLSGEICCEFIQCPINCQGGRKEYLRILEEEDIRQLDDNINCPAAISRKYSGNLHSNDWVNPNYDLGHDFSAAFKKMITIGYVQPNGNIKLRTVQSEDAFTSKGLFSTTEGIVGIISVILIICTICIGAGIYYFCCKRRQIVIKFLENNLNEEDTMVDITKDSEPKELVTQIASADSGVYTDDVSPIVI
eukprot:8858_1